jgi:hypothetical protein
MKTVTTSLPALLAHRMGTEVRPWLAVLEGLARRQVAVAGELLLFEPAGSSSPIEYLHRFQAPRHRRARQRAEAVGLAAAREWAAGPRRGPWPPTAEGARGLLVVAEELAARGERERTLELALEAEEVMAAACARGLAELADRRDLETRAYVLCGWLYRSSGQAAGLEEVVRGLEGEGVPPPSLGTEARVLALRAAAAADDGDLGRAEALWIEALLRVAPGCRLLHRDCLFGLVDVLIAKGAARDAAVLLTALRHPATAGLEADSLAEFDARTAEAWLASDVPQAAQRVLDHAAQVPPRGESTEARLALLAARAEWLARTGQLCEADALWAEISVEAKGGSPWGLRARLAQLELAVARGFEDSADKLASFRDEVRELAEETPCRAQLLDVAAQLEAGGPSLAMLADARAYLRSWEQNPSLAFERPWRGARALLRTH